MLLYLVQHAEAMNKDEDSSRSLSEKGVEGIKKVASFVKGLNIEVLNIVHSGKKRALQTAEVLADQISSIIALQESDGLAPKDDPEIWSGRISEMDRDVMLVGHLPHLAKLAARLISSDKNIVEFENAGIVCMKRAEDGNWTVDWIIKPRMLK